MYELILQAQKAIDEENWEEYEKIQAKAREEIKKENNALCVERVKYMIEVFCKHCGRRMIVYASSEQLKNYDRKNVVCMACYPVFGLK